MPGHPAAFVSYTRFNDQHDDGWVSQFCELLSAEVQVQLGEDFPIFQDRKDIAWGESWQQRIDHALDAVTLLLPIITPSFFRSSACRAEVERFLVRERDVGRDDLILPVYYVSTPALDDPERRNADELARILASRQFADWRDLRFEPLTSPLARRAIAQLANRMRDTFWRSVVRPSNGSRERVDQVAEQSQSSETAPAARVTAKTDHVADSPAAWGRTTVSKDSDRSVDNVQGDTGLEAISRYSQLDIARLLLEAKREIRMFVVSGRHVLSAQVQEVILSKLSNPRDTCKIRMLALDAEAGAALVRARGAMMNTSDAAQYAPHYEADLRLARTYARRVTSQDPTHSRFDIRFYDKLPTTFFLLIDDTLYVSFILSQPVATCPVFKIDSLRHPELATTFIDHFDYYWAKSKFFVATIGLNTRGEAVYVKNRNRGWEWPGGYIEPNEDPKEAAKRELLEETGCAIHDIQLLDDSAAGYYFVGYIDPPQQKPNTREVEEVAFMPELPTNLSFPGDRAYYIELLESARTWQIRQTSRKRDVAESGECHATE